MQKPSNLPSFSGRERRRLPVRPWGRREACCWTHDLHESRSRNRASLDATRPTTVARRLPKKDSPEIFNNTIIRLNTLLTRGFLLCQYIHKGGKVYGIIYLWWRESSLSRKFPVSIQNVELRRSFALEGGRLVRRVVGSTRVNIGVGRVGDRCLCVSVVSWWWDIVWRRFVWK